MASEHPEATQGQLRALNAHIVSAALAAVGSLLVAVDVQTWWEAVILPLSLVTALTTVSLWTAGRLFRVFPFLIVTATVWLLGVLVTDNMSASYSLAIVGSVAFYRLPRHRGAVLTGLGVFVAAGIAARLVLSDGDVLDVLLRHVLASAAVAVAAVVLTSLNQVVSDLTAQLEKSRQREAELAIVRERMRFASDLHDIQGHTLHVVKLKTALAQRLVHSDTERAGEELREIHALVGDTITQTKELAYAQRRLNLSAELENAKNLFQAAGIDVRVVREAEVDPRVGEMLGQVLRETTTNILRHAQAEQVRITLSGSGVTIVNDGVQQDSLPELGGLSTLGERVTENGGELSVEQKEGRFLTAAVFPHLDSGTASRKHEKDDR